MQVTTSTNPTPATERRARALGELPGLTWVARRDLDPDQPALAVHRDALVLRVGGRQHRWHPGLLHTRREAGWGHPLVRAMELQRGDRVLDLSLGLGIDATFLAELTGRTVLAVEGVVAVALMTAEGLRRSGADVRVVAADGLTFLRALPDDAFDVVQGDPMFPKGTGVTPSLDGLRQVGHHGLPGPEWVDQARRVARRCVVMRDIDPGTLLETLGPNKVLRVGRGRPRYGVWLAK